MRRAAAGHPQPLELVAPPLVGLLTIYCLLFFVNSVGAARRPCCGAPPGSQFVPHLPGPDRLQLAPVLAIEAEDDRWAATFEHHTIDDDARDDDSPDWRNGRLADLLECRAHACHAIAETRPASAVLSAPASIPVRRLRNYLYTLHAGACSRIQLLLWDQFAERYSAAYLQLVTSSEDMDTLELSRFRTYAELARAVVARRRDGLPARLAILR